MGVIKNNTSKTVALQAFSDIYTGGTPDRSVLRYWENGSIPWINSGSVNQGLIRYHSKLITREAVENSSTSWAKKDDLVIALAGQGRTKGTVAQMGIDACVNQSMAVIHVRPKSGFIPRFVFYAMVYQYRDIRFMTGGDKRDGLNLDHINAIRVPFYPTNIQRRIADYLDHETAEIDAAVVDLGRYVELLEKRRQVTITETVSNNSYPVKPLWGRVKVQNGYAFDAKSFTNEGDIPLARIRDILAEEYETFIQRDSIPSNRYIIRNGDLVIGMDGDFNSTVWKRGEAALNQRVCIVHTNDHTSTRFIAYAIQKPLQVVNDLRYSTTVKHLSQDDIYSMRIPLPDLETQREIADYLDEETTRIDTLIAESTKLRDLLLKRRSVLITDVVTGRKQV